MLTSIVCKSNTCDSRIQSSPGLDFCYKPQSKRQAHFSPWCHFSDSKETRKINSKNQQNHPNDQGLTLRIGRRVVLGRGQGCLAAATAAGGRPHHQPQLNGLNRLAPRTSLGRVRPPISLRSSTVKTLTLSSSSKLPMLSMVALDAALQETMFFVSFS